MREKYILDNEHWGTEDNLDILRVTGMCDLPYIAIWKRPDVMFGLEMKETLCRMSLSHV